LLTFMANNFSVRKKKEKNKRKKRKEKKVI